MKMLIAATVALTALIHPLRAQENPAAPAKPVAPPAAPAPEPVPVPYAKVGWDSATSRFTLEGKPFTGITTASHRNGKLKLRYEIREGVYHGLVEEWHDNGQQMTKTRYENGKHQGDNFYWNRDGSLQVHKVWKDDKLISETPGPKKP